MKTLKQPKTTSVLPSSNIHDETLSTDVEINEKKFREIFNNCYDIMFRSVQIHSKNKILLIYAINLVDKTRLDNMVLKPLMFVGMPNGLEQFDSIGQTLAQ